MLHLELPPAPIFIVTGPSGVGKNTLIDQVSGMFPELAFGTSRTTRDPRPDDRPEQYVHGDLDAMCAAFDAGELLEWAPYGDNFYASLRPDSSRPTIMDIELKGAAQVMAYHPNLPVTFIGVIPMIKYIDTDRQSATAKLDLHSRHPNMLMAARVGVLREHLQGRPGMDQEAIAKRLRIGQLEIAEISAYWANRPDAHVIENIEGKREEAVAQLAAIVGGKIYEWRQACDQARGAHINELESRLIIEQEFGERE